MTTTTNPRLVALHAEIHRLNVTINVMHRAMEALKKDNLFLQKLVQAQGKTLPPSGPPMSLGFEVATEDKK
jgi:hypothetical protein